ncbi:MAG: hypothetical protein M3094_11955 [Actinomycetia bacterium]|nr:hypothetical protein [Actinomycetes bacterium]
MTNRSTDIGTSDIADQAAFRKKIGVMSCSFCTSTIDKADNRTDGAWWA